MSVQHSEGSRETLLKPVLLKYRDDLFNSQNYLGILSSMQSDTHFKSYICSFLSVFLPSHTPSPHPLQNILQFQQNVQCNKKQKKKLLFTLDLEGRLIQSKNKKRNESKPTLGKFLRRSFRQSIKFRLGFVRLWRYYQLEQNFYNSKCVFPCVQASTYTGRKKMVRVILNLDFHVFEDIGEFQLLSP